MHSLLFLIYSSLLLFVLSYDRAAAINYAKTFYNNPNHDCNTSFRSCTPYSYYGSEHCGYPGAGGDCANFVSQCLIAGGHPPLKGGLCRGWPCGVEEFSAIKLSLCLRDYFKWESTCGEYLEPPENIEPGDVLVYHQGGL